MNRIRTAGHPGVIGIGSSSSSSSSSSIRIGLGMGDDSTHRLVNLSNSSFQAVEARRYQASRQMAFSPGPSHITFNKQFSPSLENYNGLILSESNRKHSIALNLPPQMPPAGAPAPVFCALLKEALASKPPPYTPMYEPPPIESCGAQQTSISRIQQQKRNQPVAAAVANRLKVNQVKSATVSGSGGLAPKTVAAPKVAAKKLTEQQLRSKIEYEDINESQLRDMLAIWDMWGPKAWNEYTADERRGKKFVPSYEFNTTSALGQKIETVKKELLSHEELRKSPVYEDITDTQVYDLIEFWDRYAPGAWREYPDEETRGMKYKSSKEYKATTTLAQVVANPLSAEAAAAAAAKEKAALAAPGGKPIGPGGVAGLSSGPPVLAKYPNPFGEDSVPLAKSVLPEDQELFVSPFIRTARMADAKKGVPSKQFKADSIPVASHACAQCGQSFRLPEALVRHYQQRHNMKIPAEELQQMRLSVLQKSHGLKPTAAQLKAQEDAKTYASRAVSGENLSTTPAAASDNEVAVQGGKLGGGRFDGELDVATHIRAPANTHLLGKVVKMDAGFLKADSAIQLIVEVEETETFTEPGSDEVKHVHSVERIAVRCLGDEYTRSLRGSVGLNDNVFVTGNLKLNRQLGGKGSDKAYAYPYIQVVPPLGSLVKM